MRATDASSKLTPWFHGEVKPEREGIYNITNQRGDRYFAEYRNGVWSAWSPSPLGTISRIAAKSARSLRGGDLRTNHE